ncbi:thermonuclease family protein [Bacillus sp. 1P06AnD]|uniref:thermonuclease family protein n=1 Tax=Bacillus sp. 1P06AnD TaxID=3132208 RepID=UPI0039A15D2E
MKFISTLLLAALLLSGCSAGNNDGIHQTDRQTSGDSEHQLENATTASVVRVVDGDTILVRLDGKQEKVRLLLVDTPETVKANTPVQPFGPEASAFTKKMLPEGKQIQLTFDQEKRDQYGRMLAYVYMDGKMLNERLLEEGLARVVVFKPNVKYVDTFREIEEKAKEKKLGIWSLKSNQSGSSSQQSKGATINTPSQGTCSEPTIKGNINHKGEKIYHLPGGQSYSQTKAEEMFCSENDAKKAGFRPATR